MLLDSYIKELKTKNIHVVGASGTEGSAILEFLTKNGVKNITAHDFSVDQSELKRNFFKTHLWLKGEEKTAAFSEFLKLPISLRLKSEYLKGILDAGIIFVPSSWHLYSPNFSMFKKVKAKGIEISSLTKLYFELAEGKIISITGTKGKGTTSKLIYEILRQGQDKFCSGEKRGRAVYLAGNDRRSAQELDKVAKMKKEDILVLETSNRQLLIDFGRSPDIGVITNISPDHIDEHGNFENYIDVKKSLFRHMQKGQAAILNFDNEATKKIGEELAGRGSEVFYFSRKEKIENGAYVENEKIMLGNLVSKSGEEYICGLEDIKLIGEHNIENVLASVLSGYLAGAKPEDMRNAIRNYRGLPHRIEFLGEHSGVKFYDDLASTNPDSTIAAVRSLKKYRSRITGQKLVLVAGGDDKGMDYSGLVKNICKNIDLLILLPGSGTDVIKYQLSNIKCSSLGFTFISTSDILESVMSKHDNNSNSPDMQNARVVECEDFRSVLGVIKSQTKTGDIVLISPAAAHFQARYIDTLKKPLRNIIVEKFK